MPSRRFPPPWSAEVTPTCFIVRDADGQQLAYIYYSNDPDRRSAAKLLTKDEARRIAANIAKLPELLAQGLMRGLPYAAMEQLTRICQECRHGKTRAEQDRLRDY